MRQTLDETNTTTECDGSAITSRDTLGTSDVTTMAPFFSPHSVGHFLRRNFLLLLDANWWGSSMLLFYSLHPLLVFPSAKWRLVFWERPAVWPYGVHTSLFTMRLCRVSDVVSWNEWRGIRYAVVTCANPHDGKMTCNVTANTTTNTSIDIQSSGPTYLHWA